MRTARRTMYFDADGMADLERIAGPFGEAGRVVSAALKDGREASAGRVRGKLNRCVEIVVHPATDARIQSIADERDVSWMEAMRRLVEQWVADYDATGGGIQRAS